MIIPIPLHQEPDIEPPYPQNDEERCRWIRWYIDSPPWKCVKCKTTNFGRVRHCAYCRVRLNTDTPRPTDYKENTYERD